MRYDAQPTSEHKTPGIQEERGRKDRRVEDVSEVLVCYSLGVYETQSNPQATRVIA